MILQQLTIHNLASIEDATIDFEAQPLADSEVFLITGKTGAGKSTILDAICLALYATTPRLDSTNMQGDTKDQDKDIKIKDPVQLMRRNTGEAFVELTFMGSNGIHYEATWSVARAHKKVTGKIQAKKWQLRNLDTDFTYNKDKEIREEIAIAIGLDFKQFCRTTLLAQGEFTRFLNSKDDDKAEILEKITGVDAYSKIGIKIFEKTSEMRKIWEEAQQKTAGITLLTEEEIADKNNELETLAQQDKLLKTDAESINKKLVWLKDEHNLRLQKEKARKEFEKAKEILGSDKTQEEERIITLWNNTIDARHWLKETEMQAAHIVEFNSSLSACKNYFQQVQEAYQQELFAADNIAQRKRQIDDYLMTEQSKLSLYENAQTIYGYMRNMEEGRKKMAEFQKGIYDLQEKLKKVFLPQLKDAKEELTNLQNTLDYKENYLRERNQDLEKADYPRLRKQKEKCKTVSLQIRAALSAIELYKEEVQRFKDAQANLTALAKDIKHKKEKIKELDQLLHDAEIAKNTTKEIYEKQRESINKWAKSIRMKLHIGDICPVCQQQISSALPHEESLDALVAETEKSAKNAEEKYEQLAKEKNVLDANILALTRQYQNDSIALEKGKKSLANAEEKKKVALAECQLETKLDTEDVKSAYQRITHLLEDLEEKVAAADRLDKYAKELQIEVEMCRKQVEKQKDIVNQTEKLKIDCEHKIGSFRTLFASKEAEVNDAFQKAKQLIGSDDWNKTPIAYAKQIQKAATIYNKYLEEKQKLEKVLVSYQLNNDNLAVIIRNILQLTPSWENLKTEGHSVEKDSLEKREIPITYPEKLSEQATALQGKVASILSHIQTSQQELEKNQKLLNDFIARQHEDSIAQQHDAHIAQQQDARTMDVKLLKTLNLYSQAAIAEKTSLLNQAKQSLSQKEAIFKTAQKAYQKHLTIAQEIGFERSNMRLEESDMALEENSLTNLSLSLTSRLQTLETERQELNNKRGGIIRDLEINQANLQEIGNLKKEEDKKKAEYNKWDRLNQLLGDASGNKFRRIAQSYVLASLIHSANSYMRTLTSRYVLRIVPGTFVITLEDAYQGYTSRAASTLSGGESFLVSLSLALALSDIGNQLAVDTLFIDEGFGTLSGEPLQHAINTLRGLHSKSGRHVGIISHVEELKERIPVQIRVNQEGNNSSSTIEIVG